MSEQQNPEETASDLPEGVEIQEVDSEAFAQFIQQLTAAQDPDAQRRGQEAYERGKEELRGHGDALDPSMHEFMGLVYKWGQEMKEKFNLSSEAVCVLMETAPDVHELYHGGRDYVQEAEADGGN